jgi:hypothetical protein
MLEKPVVPKRTNFAKPYQIRDNEALGRPLCPILRERWLANLNDMLNDLLEDQGDQYVLDPGSFHISGRVLSNFFVFQSPTSRINRLL